MTEYIKISFGDADINPNETAAYQREFQTLIELRLHIILVW